MAGLFSDWQPRYAEAGIATFPVRDKRPAVKGYLRTGLRASERFAAKFPDVDQFGFAVKPNGITVLDVDTPDERLLRDALDEYGPTPIIIRSGSGNWQAWYKRNGEGRRVRPNPKRPIDILGHGFVVAPPSVGSKGRYELVSGSLDDLVRLPVMRRVAALGPANDLGDGERIENGQRNNQLWRACMAQARNSRSLGELWEFAMLMNQTAFHEPLPLDEVSRIVASAWAKETSGENWFGGGSRVIMSHDEIDGLLRADPDAFVLLTCLRRHHWGRTFAIANAMAETMPGGGWRRERFTAARQRLVDAGQIVMVRPASYHRPAEYRFKGAQK